MDFDQPPVVSVEVDPGRAPRSGVWPMTIPAVAQLARDGLDLPRGVTFLVGEDGLQNARGGGVLFLAAHDDPGP